METELFFWLAASVGLIVISFIVLIWRLIDARKKLFAENHKIDALEARLIELEKKIDNNLDNSNE